MIKNILSLNTKMFEEGLTVSLLLSEKIVEFCFSDAVVDIDNKIQTELQLQTWRTSTQTLTCCKLSFGISFSKNWQNGAIWLFRNCREGKKGPATLLATWLFKHAECLTSVFCLSSFWTLFWNHYSQWNTAQCSAYKPILSDKVEDTFTTQQILLWFILLLLKVLLVSDSITAVFYSMDR